LLARALRIGSRLLAAAFICSVLTVSACGTMPGVRVADRQDDGLDVGVPGNVYEVRTLGSWRDGKRAGAFRVVTLRGGFDHVHTSLIIQWMEQGLGEEAPDVVDERRVEGLDDLGPIVVLAVREAAAPDGLQLSIRTRNVVTGEEADVEVRAGAPGQLK
jgi:hypothetical protein